MVLHAAFLCMQTRSKIQLNGYTNLELSAKLKFRTISRTVILAALVLYSALYQSCCFRRAHGLRIHLTSATLHNLICLRS